MIDNNRLSSLDARGYAVLEALASAGLTRAASHARPNAFICVDGKTYWAKGQAQQGLVAELVAGRLASKLNAGPLARVIRLTEGVASGDPHLEGVVVGIEDLPNTINSKDLQPFLAGGQFDPGIVNPSSRARVIAFQTWLGVVDAQVLVSMTDGSIWTIDHGDAFAATATQTDPSIVIAPIPGVPDTVGKEVTYVEEAVRRIELISDNDLLIAVAGIPAGDPWRSPVDRRVEIAQWLAHRRGRIREVMGRWLQT